VFGPQGAWNDGKEKAPAALCRKVAECVDGGTIDIWGPGTQTRSFLYIDECLTGLELIMASSIDQPINLGSDRMIRINDLALLIARLNKKQVSIRNIDGPLGVMGRTSDNNLIRKLLDWAPDDNLEYGLIETYKWIKEQVHALQQNR
jgi:nucleoside-diphosphate-sugar epimerase